MSGIISDEPLLIPEGTYTVSFIRYETTQSWGRYKVLAHFAVAEGEYGGTPLTRYYNVDDVSSSPGQKAEFSASARRHLVREFRTLLPDLASQGALDLNAYKGKLIWAEVETVGQDGLKQDLSQANRYSVIRRLVKIIPDDYEVLFDEPQTRVGKEEVGQGGEG